MAYNKGFKRLRRLLGGLLFGLALIALTAAVTVAQSPNSASKLNSLCRQVNPNSTPGFIAYYAPGINPIKAADDRKDGPGVNEAVYLTSASPEISADGKYIRVWFSSLDPNYKLGWINKRFGNDDALKMGDARWRGENCSQ